MKCRASAPVLPLFSPHSTAWLLLAFLPPFSFRFRHRFSPAHLCVFYLFVSIISSFIHYSLALHSAHFYMQWFLEISFEMCPSLGVCWVFQAKYIPFSPFLAPLWKQAVSGVIRKCAATALFFPGFRFFRQHEFYWLQGQSAHFNLFSTKLWCHHSYINFRFKTIFINL